MNDLLLTYYGDDFTGSTDVMECLELYGIPTVLFLAPPDQQRLAGRFAHVRAAGVAGVSRTMTPAQMDDELIPAFEALKALNAPFFHYKICSTFDSSPTVGSIGHATELGYRVFNPPLVPMMVGAPFIRRYVVFGNLFARVGDVTYRLDRHPTMSRHPVTPMHESDLRLHLGQQTERRIGLVDIWHMDQGDEVAGRWFQKVVADGAEIVIFDTISDEHMRQIGKIVWGLRGVQPVLLVGSSGFERALGLHLRTIGALPQEPALRTDAGKVEQLVVVSGSCAPGTDEQIGYAIDRGFGAIRLNGSRLVDPATADAEREAAVEQAITILSRGNSVVIFSARGPEDPAIAATKAHLEQLNLDPHSLGERLGSQQGRLLRAILERTGLRRACVVGGDTCGFAAKQLGIFALQMVIPVAPGAPLCRASSDEARFDGLEISLKGGQNGTAEYFLQILNGRT
jgi:uncharacterized protein YgbK (DUF1537 family)